MTARRDPWDPGEVGLVWSDVVGWSELPEARCLLEMDKAQHAVVRALFA